MLHAGDSSKFVFHCLELRARTTAVDVDDHHLFLVESNILCLNKLHLVTDDERGDNQNNGDGELKNYQD